MEEGYIENRDGPIVWSPEKTWPLFRHTRANPKKNQHEIGSYTFMDRGRARAWYCPACEIAILYNQDNEVREAVL